MPRRLAFTGPYRAEILEYTDAALEADEVLLRMEMASGKHGTTTAMFDGSVWQGKRFDADNRLFVDSGEESPAPKLPSRSGTTGVGVVEAVGKGVTRWKPGDRVFGEMDIRETNICRADALWELGEIAPETALCLEPGYVAIHCIRESNLRYGDRVAVFGLGAIGQLVVEMARAGGASFVAAVDLLPKRRARAKDHGADVVLDPREGDVALRLREMTDGMGVDISIEISGAYPALDAAIRSARVGGLVCSAGFYQGDASGLWLGREWHHNRLTMVVPHGCGWGHEPRDYPAWDAARARNTLVSQMRKGTFRAEGLIHPVVQLENAPDVFRRMKDEPDSLLKFGVRFGESPAG